MPARRGLRPLKAWRYIGVYGPELMLCIGAVRIGPARQSFWAIWDRETGELRERTTVGKGSVWLPPRAAAVRERRVQIELELDEEHGIETVSPSGEHYAWTRKQGGIRAHGMVTIDGAPRRLEARAVIDDTAAYYERHTRWLWSAGVGVSVDGRAVAWNLVDGVNDAPADSERTIWIDGVPHEPPPSSFARELDRVDELTFHPEAVREREDNLVLIRSSYRQPFGTFAGKLTGGVELAEGYGVMEAHEARW
jgi:hypothetical protein